MFQARHRPPDGAREAANQAGMRLAEAVAGGEAIPTAGRIRRPTNALLPEPAVLDILQMRGGPLATKAGTSALAETAAGRQSHQEIPLTAMQELH